MKKLLMLAAATATVLGLGLAQDFRVGMSYDAGGKNDRSFNQSTYNGAQQAVKDLGVKYFDFEPGDPSQVGQGIRKFAEEGFDAVVGVGFANEPSITKTAMEFKDTKFAVIDAVPCFDDKTNKTTCPNAVGLVFREQEGSFLVGYIAGRLSSTATVGFVGGMDIPLIHKFEAGYRAGAEAAFKDRGVKGKVISNYVGNTPAAWNDPGKAKEIATAQARQGADIIYAAAGASGLGVLDYVKQKMCINQTDLPSGTKFITNSFANVPKYPAYSKACNAATTRPMFMVGVDANQNYLGDTDKNPATLNHVLTSMMKRVDVATYQFIKSVKDKTFKPGVEEFGLSNNGVGYALDEYNKALIPAGVLTRVEQLKQEIIAGKIKVPTQ